MKTVGIVGTGMIASSMAVLTAGHGWKTVVFARSRNSADRCSGVVNDYYAQMVEKGIIDEGQAEICKSYIKCAFDYSEMKDAEIVFESVLETTDAKYEVFAKLEENCPRIKAICSVSSSIVPNILAEGAGKNADKILVAHPFNPPHMVPYFEICGADSTAPEAIEYACGFLKAMDRKPVVLKRPTPGFIGNRLQFALWREALALVEEGICDPRDVDTCLEYSFCPRYTSIGIFEHFDNGGLELNAAACRNIWPILSNRTDIPDFMKKLMEECKMGPRSDAKEGFYDWHDVDMKRFAERVSAPYWGMLSWEFPKEKSE